MDSKKIVIHKGIIKSIKADRMIVGIVVQAGCASCDIKESCNLSETSEKEIDIIGINKQFKVGQQVKVKMKASQGFHALFLGYVLPFVLLLLVMIIGTNVSENEALIGVISLLSLIPYYIVLYFFKNRIKKKFSYAVEPLN